MMEIEQGWRLFCADFSIQAHGEDSHPGNIMLVRAPEDRRRWHMMTDDQKESNDAPPLYVSGKGITLAEALQNANLVAAHARPIP